MGESVPDVLQSTSSSPLSSLLYRLVHFQNILDQWKSLTFDGFEPNMVKHHHLQFRCHVPLFYKSTWFNITAAMAHHPIIQKEGNELLPKGSIESWMGASGFYSTLSNVNALCTYFLLRCQETGMVPCATR